MAFQDFDHLSERRKFERQQKFRKRVTIAAISAFVLIILIAAGVFGLISQNPDGDSKSSKNISRVQNMISTICNGTTYKNSCTDSLSAAARKDPSIDEPRKFLKASMAATVDELDEAMKKAESYNFNTPETKAAFNVCKQVMDDAKKELNVCVSQVDATKDIKKLVERAGDLNNWLSAVLSFQQTCIDGFPEGDVRTDMAKNLNATRQLTSNSLAMINQCSIFLSPTEENQGTQRRRLLESIDGEVLPYSWMSHQERKLSEEEEKKDINPNLTVAKDGSGNFTKISEALAAVPQDYKGRFVIYVKEGIYEERVIVLKRMVNLTIVGDGSQKSIIVGNRNVADGGIRKYDTATFVARGEGLFVKSMGFRNTADPQKGGAVAARVQSDRAIFQNCRFEGYQNTLWAQAHRQVYRSCLITGTIDFIFGDAAAVFQNCKIKARKPLDGQKNTITAQSRIDKFETTGFVIQNCKISADESLEPVKNSFSTYLGRPLKQYSRTIVMESELGDLIHPEGWLAMKENYGIRTLYFAEFDNKGPGASTQGRVKWPGYNKAIDKKEAMKFTVGPFLKGDDWIKKTGASVQFGLF